MTEPEVAWVAGLLEGEGCFVMRSRALAVSCGMSDEDVIQRLHSVVACGHVNGPYLKENRKPFWTWEVGRREQVVDLLVSIRPLMGVRRTARIDEMLDWNMAYPLGRLRKDAAQHGSLGMYSNHGCRCVPCVETWNAYQRERYAENKAAA